MARLYTIKPELRKDKANSRGECPLALVLHMHGKRSRILLHRYLKAEHWDTSAGMPKRNYPGYATLAPYITTKEQQAKDVLDGLFESGTVPVATAVAAIKVAIMPAGAKLDLVTEQQSPELRDFMSTLFKDKQFCGRWKASTLKDRGHKAKSLGYFLPNPMPMHALTPTGITHICDALGKGGTFETPDGVVVYKGQAPQSVNGSMSVLKAVYEWAKARGVIELNPFDQWSPLRVTKASRVRHSRPLTLDECARINKLTDHSNRPIASTAAYFLLECYSGLRRSDWRRWKIEEASGGKRYLRLPHGTQKTGEPVRLLLNNSPLLSALVKKIEERFPTYTSKANETLKDIARLAGIDHPLSSHYGRHTAATQLYDRGFSVSEVADVLGTTEETARGYITSVRSQATRAFEQKGGI